MTPSTNPVVCADCGRSPLETVSGAAKRLDVFVEMVPGRDGKRWHLCGRCVVDARTMKTGRVKKAEAVSDEFVGALVATGWTSTPNADGTNTISPPERLTNPPRRRRA